MKLQTAINQFSEFISLHPEKDLKDAPFRVKWRLRFSKIGWLSIMTWKIKWTEYKTNRSFKKLSPEKRKKFIQALEGIFEKIEREKQK